MLYCSKKMMNNYEVCEGCNDSMHFIAAADCNHSNVFTYDTRRRELSMFFGLKLLTLKFTPELPMGVLEGTVKRAALRKAFLKRYKKTMMPA